MESEEQSNCFLITLDELLFTYFLRILLFQEAQRGTKILSCITGYTSVINSYHQGTQANLWTHIWVAYKLMMTQYLILQESHKGSKTIEELVWPKGTGEYIVPFQIHKIKSVKGILNRGTSLTHNFRSWCKFLWHQEYILNQFDFSRKRY